MSDTNCINRSNPSIFLSHWVLFILWVRILFLIMFSYQTTLCILAAYVALGEAVSKSDVLSYFYNISGSKTIAGQHNREPNSDPSKWTRTARDITGKFPGLWGGDFLYLPDDVQHRQTMIDEAIKEWKAGSVVALTWHVCPPNKGETCNWDSDGVLSQFTDEEWNSLIQDGSDLNQKWKQRLDTIVPYLQQLKDNGVVAVWRPLHEINEGWSWWAGRPGANGSRKLYQITHDYLAPKFDNLIWNWNVADYYIDSIGDYWPGGDYVDVASLDVWFNKQPKNEHYQKMLSVAQGKPIALAEVGSVPSPSTLEQQNKWIWFMVWAEYLKDPSYNSDQSVKDTYYLSRSLRQGEMDFGSGSGSENLALNRPVTASSQQDSSTGPGNIVDGSSNKWSSDENLEQWIYVDLGASKSVSKVVVEWDADYAKGYQIQTSNDENTWTTVYEKQNGYGGSDEISVSASGRWVKIYMFQKGWGSRYSVIELKIYSQNLALNRPVTASSQQDSSTGPGNIVDGSSNKWSSDENLEQWIYVDLGASKSFSKVVVEWDADYAKGYQIQTYNDENTWTTVYEKHNGYGGSDEISLSASGRWVKIYMYQKGGGSRYSIKELKIYS